MTDREYAMACADPEPRAFDVTIRHLPSLIWLRIGICARFRSPAAWQPESSYHGMVGRIRWTVRGYGLFAIWLLKKLPEEGS